MQGFSFSCLKYLCEFLILNFFGFCSFQCLNREPDRYSAAFHSELNKRLKVEGFHGTYILIKNGKEILSNYKDTTRVFRTPGLTHFLSCIRILKLWEEGILDIDDPIGLHVDQTVLSQEPYRQLPIRSFMNHTSGTGTLLAPGEYWNFSLENAKILFKISENFKSLSSRDGNPIYELIPDPRQSSLQDWIQFEIRFSKGEILSEKTIFLLSQPTILKDSYTSNRFQFGLGVFLSGKNYWAISRTNSDSLLYYRISEENVGILIHTRGKRSRGDMLSWKSILTESMYGQRYIDLSPWIEIPEPYRKLSTLSLEEEMARTKVPAISVAIVENFRLSTRFQIGLRNSQTREPVTDRTLFRAGSLSKPFTAFALESVLQENGIPDSVSLNRLAADSGVDLSYWRAYEPTPKLTPFHLMAHTSGITERSDWGTPENQNARRLRELNRGRGAELRVYYLPGTKSRYSGGGYALLQEYLVNLTGKEFDTLMNEQIFTPLTMKSSFWKEGEKNFEYVSGHDSEGKPIENQIYTRPEWGAGGLWTKAEDLAMFFLEWQKCLHSQMDCKLSRSVVRELLRPVIPAANLSVQSWIGKGIFLNTSGKELYFYHGGHSKGHKSSAIFHKTKGYGIVIMTNSESGSQLIWSILRSVSIQKKWDKFIN